MLVVKARESWKKGYIKNFRVSEVVQGELEKGYFDNFLLLELVTTAEGS